MYEMSLIGNYHDLHVQSDTLLIADIFEMFRDTCIKTFYLDLGYSISHQP